MKYFLLIFVSFINSFSYSQYRYAYDSLLLNRSQNQVIPGYSILVSNFDSIIYQSQYGYSNLNNQTLITENTKFRIASVTKQFTAIAILKLVQEGKISLNSSVQDYVEFIPKKITIEHLLWHTSGLVCYFNDLDIPDSSYIHQYNSLELVSVLKDQKRISKPNKEYHYNNFGYHILGFIIEQISDKSYADYLMDNFFIPLNMHNTECENSSSDIEKLATGYELIDSNFIAPNYYTMDWPYAAGNIVSTPTDLLKWHKALFNEEIISDSLLNKANTAYILKKEGNTLYGYGWEIRKIQDEKTVRHSGYLEGYLSTLIFIPELNMTVVVLTNCSNYSTELLGTKLAALAMGKPIYSPKKINLTHRELEKFDNKYNFEKDVIVFEIIDNALCFYFEYDSANFHPLYSIEKNVFYSDEFGCKVIFDIETNSITLKIGEKKTTGKNINTK
jgi:CubicO group peptidase (beta-lactamase class C family)